MAHADLAIAVDWALAGLARAALADGLLPWHWGAAAVRFALGGESRERFEREFRAAASSFGLLGVVDGERAAAEWRRSTGAQKARRWLALRERAARE